MSPLDPDGQTAQSADDAEDAADPEQSDVRHGVQDTVRDPTFAPVIRVLECLAVLEGGECARDDQEGREDQPGGDGGGDVPERAYLVEGEQHCHVPGYCGRELFGQADEHLRWLGRGGVGVCVHCFCAVGG